MPSTRNPCKTQSSRHIPCAVHLESLQKLDGERHGGACLHLLSRLGTARRSVPAPFVGSLQKGARGARSKGKRASHASQIWLITPWVCQFATQCSVNAAPRSARNRAQPSEAQPSAVLVVAHEFTHANFEIMWILQGYDATLDYEKVSKKNENTPKNS